MITQERLKELMQSVGMPESLSLYQALMQCDKEARMDERDRLGKDSARLTWLEKREAAAVSHHEYDGDGYTIWWQVVVGDRSISGHPLGGIREAIDAAMNGANNQVQPASGE